jgi:hypothetical protein
MDIKTFLEAVNENPIQQYGSHESFTDVTFALFRAKQVDNDIEVTGWWMNINYGGPIQDGYDTFLIKGEDVHKWHFHSKFPKRNA